MIASYRESHPQQHRRKTSGCCARLPARWSRTPCKAAASAHKNNEFCDAEPASHFATTKITRSISGLGTKFGAQITTNPAPGINGICTALRERKTTEYAVTGPSRPRFRTGRFDPLRTFASVDADR